MKDNLLLLGMVAVAALLFGLGVWWSMLLWDECRETNSWLFCVKMLSR